MKIDEAFQIGFNAIKGNKIRAFLTMLGIIIGVAAVILLVSIGSGLQQYITRQFEDLGSNLVIIMPGKVSFQDEGAREGGPPGIAANKLTFKLAQDLERKLLYAKTVLPVVAKSVVAKYGNNSKSTGLVASTENYTEVRNSPVSLGRSFSKADVDSSKKVAIIGTTLKKELFNDVDPINKRILVADSRYTVVGVFAEKGAMMGQDMDDVVAIPITAAIKQFNAERLNYIYLQAPDAETAPKTVAEAKNYLLKEMGEDDFSVLDQKDLASTVDSILSVLTAGLGGIAAISLLVGGIGIMNIMLVSVTERTREIGLRKAVGATFNDILTQFLIEAVFLSLVGGIIGIILGFLGSLVLGQFLQTAVTTWSVTIAFSVSFIVGIVFGVAPALKAAKLDPIEALRYE
jgi:putative ABC transport system permease protein